TSSSSLPNLSGAGSAAPRMSMSPRGTSARPTSMPIGPSPTSATRARGDEVNVSPFWIPILTGPSPIRHAPQEPQGSGHEEGERHGGRAVGEQLPDRRKRPVDDEGPDERPDDRGGPRREREEAEEAPGLDVRHELEQQRPLRRPDAAEHETDEAARGPE